MNPATENVWAWVGIGGVAVLIVMALIIFVGRSTGRKMVNGD